MIMKLKLLTLAAIVGCIAPTMAQPNTDTNGLPLVMSIPIKSRLLEYESNVMEFKTNGSVMMSHEKMGKALQSLEDALNKLKNCRTTVDRKEQAVLWFEILAIVDRDIDLNFIATNANTHAFFRPSISPPPGYTGRIGPNGMEPPDTNNAALRAYYETAVKAHAERMKKANFQSSLLHISKKADLEFEEFLKRTYTSSEPDKNEFEELLKQSKLLDVRKQKLTEMLNRLQ